MGEWRKAKGMDVYVENGKVIRGTIGSGTEYRTAYPYKLTKWGYEKGTPTLSAFRNGKWELR